MAGCSGVFFVCSLLSFMNLWLERETTCGPKTVPFNGETVKNMCGDQTFIRVLISLCIRKRQYPQTDNSEKCRVRTFP